MTRSHQLLLAGLGLVVVASVAPQTLIWLVLAWIAYLLLRGTRRKPRPGAAAGVFGVAALGLGAFTVTSGHPVGLLAMLLGGALLAGRRQHWWGGRTLPDDRALFALALADLLELEVPLPEAVAQLARDNASPGVLQSTLPGVLRTLEAGSGLAGAVAGEGAFPLSWSRCLAAAERTGSLPATLRRLAALDERRPERLAYVGTLLMLSGLITVFASTYVMPTFVTLFQGMSLPLPFLTRGLVWLLKFVHHPVVGLALLATLAAAVVWRARLRRLALRLPGVRRLHLLGQQRVAVALLEAALASGMTVPEALETAARGLEPSPLCRALEEASRTGVPVGVLALNNPELFSSRVGWLLASGERHGQLVEALAVAAGSLECEHQEALARAQTLLETGLLALMGILVGGLVSALLTPLYQLILPLAEALLP